MKKGGKLQLDSGIVQVSTKNEDILDIIGELRNQIAIFKRELKEGRLGIPDFQEDDVYGWLIQIQLHFNMKKRGKLQSVVKVLEGHAYDWYKQWGGGGSVILWYHGKSFRGKCSRNSRPGMISIFLLGPRKGR